MIDLEPVSFLGGVLVTVLTMLLIYFIKIVFYDGRKYS